MPGEIVKVFVKLDPLWHVWVLDDHFDFRAGTRTPAGKIVYEAKPYGDEKGSSRAAVDRLVQLMHGAGRNPVARLFEVDALVGVPAHVTKTGTNLPSRVADGLAAATGIPHASELVVKARQTPEIKRMANQAKADALANVFRVAAPEGASLPRRVLVIDDLLYSGHTLNSVARTLHEGGVPEVTAFAATRVRRGMATS